MADAKTISANVMEHSAAINDARVSERSAATYFHTFWDAYKGHVRGMLVGIATHGFIGLGVGIALSLVVAPVLILPVIAACTGAGALFGADLFGEIGSAAASRASALAEKHARMLDPAHEGDLEGALDDKLMVDGRGHHYEFPASRDKGKFFSWKSGSVGTLLGIAVGGLAAVTGLLSIGPAGPLFALLGGKILAGMLLGGLCGSTFGIERSFFKSVFNQTDANIKGKLLFHHGPDQGKAQFAATENNYQLNQHRLRRQTETTYLQKQYYDKIFWGGVKGSFRGLAGGIALGAMIGVGVGVLAYVALQALALTPFLAAPPAFSAVIAGFSALGSLLGMEVFDKTGLEAGSESTARALDDEFERNRLLQQKGIMPPVPAKSKAHGFNLKTALVMGALGAVAGLALSSPLSIGLITAALPANTAASVIAAVASQYSTVIAVVVGAVSGASFGIGLPFWKSMTRVTDHIYERSYFRDGDPEPDKAPVIIRAPEAPSRPLRATSVTPEEAARLDTRLGKAQDKGFAQTILNNPCMAPAMPTL